VDDALPVSRFQSIGDLNGMRLKIGATRENMELISKRHSGVE